MTELESKGQNPSDLETLRSGLRRLKKLAGIDLVRLTDKRLRAFQREMEIFSRELAQLDPVYGRFIEEHDAKEQGPNPQEPL